MRHFKIYILEVTGKKKKNLNFKKVKVLFKDGRIQFFNKNKNVNYCLYSKDVGWSVL